MLLYLMLCFLLVSGLHAVENSNSLNNDENEWHYIKSFMESRCLENANKDALEDFLHTANNVGRCIKGPKRHAETTSEEYVLNVKWCTDYPELNYNCMEGLMNKMEPCLKSEEKYLTNFFLSSYNASFERYCKDGEKATAEKVLKIADYKCEYAPGDTINNATKECLPNIKFAQNADEPDFVLRISDFTGYVEKVKSCIVDFLNSKCEDHAFSDLVETFFDAHLGWLKEHKSENLID